VPQPMKTSLCLLLAMSTGTSTCFAKGPACRPSSAPAAAGATRPPLQVATANRPRPSVLLSAADGAAGTPPRHQVVTWLVRNRSLLLLLALVVHKCASDLLTRYTRLQGAYSINTVAIMSEVMKIPLILSAICTIGGGARQIIPVFREAASKPFGNVWISLCYTFNNLLYFDALSSLSAVTYQVLSQSKTLFTAGLMYVLVRKRLAMRQVLAIGLLVVGAVLVQLQELMRAAAPAAAVGTGSIYWAAGLVLFSSFISALPNVYYEKVLKTEGQNEWVNNVQVTAWITLWVTLNGLVWRAGPMLRGLSAAASGGSPASAVVQAVRSLPDALSSAFAGFTLPVWGVVMLKALNGILIPATFKYADNLLYSYAKPSSIVVTTILAALAARAVPPASLLVGVTIVVASIMLYNTNPKPAKQD